MKKLLLAGALAIVGIFSAQDKGLQGTWFASCQVGYQQTKTDDSKITNTTILPIVGTFVAPTTAVGIAVGNISVNNENGVPVAGVDKLKTNLLVIEPLVRKYWNVSGGLFFFGQLAAPIVNGKAKAYAGGNEISAAEVKVSQFGLAMSGGFDYVMTKHFTVEFSYNLANLSFTSIKNYPGVGDIKTTDFSLAHIATVAPEYNQAVFGANGNAVTPLSFGFKFLF